MCLECFIKVVNQQRKKTLKCEQNIKFIFKDVFFSVSLFVSLSLPTHNWCIISPLIVSLVPEDS